MNNRLKQYFEPSNEAPRTDFWQVLGRHDGYLVDERTALGIIAMTAKRWPPRWLYFNDIFGVRVSLRSRDVVSVSESSFEGRRIARRFLKELHDEEPRDEPWEGC